VSSTRRSRRRRSSASVHAQRQRGSGPTRSDTSGRPASVAGASTGLDRAVWEREMRRLRSGSRLLLMVLIALGVRVIVAGLTVVIGLTLAIIGVLFLASLLLTRQGRRLEPRDPPGRRLDP
jgi:hypothetical protein